jgi:hypothetical protein
MVLEQSGLDGRYRSTIMKASHLPDPSLNVMFGANAIEGAARYAQGDGVVIVKMTLGDIRKATGGQVRIFHDHSAVVNGKGCEPLLITVPEGCQIPVKIVSRR